MTEIIYLTIGVERGTISQRRHWGGHVPSHIQPFEELNRVGRERNRVLDPWSIVKGSCTISSGKLSKADPHPMGRPDPPGQLSFVPGAARIPC